MFDARRLFEATGPRHLQFNHLTEIDLSGRGIVNDFDEADNMRVDALFHDGNLATDLLLVRCLGPSQASTGSLVHNLDGLKR